MSFCLYAQDSNSFNIGLCGNTYVGKYQYKSKKLHCLNNGNYYFSSFDKNSSKSEFIVTCTNVLTKSQDKLTFKLSPELKLSENTLESNFLVHNEKAYILSFKSLFIFKQRGNVFIQDTTILLNIGFRRIFALDDSSISLVSHYNYNELEKDACVKVYLLSTSDLVLSQVYANERPLGIELSHYVHQNIDMKGNQIIIAHPLKYSVEWGTIVKGKIEKKALVYLDTLDDNLELYKETLESFSVNTPIKLQLYYLDSILRKHCVNRIEKVMFVDSNKFMVSLINHCDRDYRQIDIWELDVTQSPFLVSSKKYKMGDSKFHGDYLNFDYSLPIYFENGKAFEISYYKPTSVKKAQLKEFQLLEFCLEE